MAVGVNASEEEDENASSLHACIQGFLCLVLSLLLSLFLLEQVAGENDEQQLQELKRGEQGESGVQP